MGLVAPWHVGSSWTRAGTRVPCIGRWILNHCATREVPKDGFNKRLDTAKVKVTELEFKSEETVYSVTLKDGKYRKEGEKMEGKNEV